ncbi:hypothetical protein AM593_05697, partial [Mytilus galloprovincialis]
MNFSESVGYHLNQCNDEKLMLIFACMVKDIADLEERRKRVQSALLPSKKIIVKRENIVEDLMDQ